MIIVIRTLVWVDLMILQSNIEVDVYYYYSPISMTTIIRADPINRGQLPHGLLSIPVDAKQQSKKGRQQSTTRPNYAKVVQRTTVDRDSHPSYTTTDATSSLCHNDRRRDVTTDSLPSTRIQIRVDAIHDFLDTSLSLRSSITIHAKTLH